MSEFQQWRYWSHQWGLKDMTSCNYDYFNPTSLHSRGCKLTRWGCGMSALAPCINLWSDHFLLNTNACKSFGVPHAMEPTPLLPCQMGRKSCSSNKLRTLVKTLWKGSGFGQPLKCQSVKLQKPPRVSNTWHKEQNPIYKCINVDFLLSVSILTFLTVKKKENIAKTEN